MLPSWSESASRSSVLAFLDAASEIPPSERIAVFDNDGTLWCEKPEYIQLEFLVDRLRAAVARSPELAGREEYRALLAGDSTAVGEMGLQRVATALLELCADITPEAFDRTVREFFAAARHRDHGVPFRQMRYRPMLELIGELRAREFSVFVVSGGGTEFVRAIGDDFYGVPPQNVLGTEVEYRLDRSTGAVRLLRTNNVAGPPNEGAVKITGIHRMIGRRPVFAAGNSAGDAEMLEYAAAADGGLAVVVDHDDADREYAYASVAGSLDDTEPILETAARHGWTVVSMADDWRRVFDHDEARHG